MRKSQPGPIRQSICLAAVAVVVMALFNWYADAEAAWANQSISPGLGATGFVTHVQEGEGRPTRVIVIDPQQRVMAVYEIGREKAEIRFLSSRNLSYDLQMLSFNSLDPSPEDIKKTLELQ